MGELVFVIAIALPLVPMAIFKQWRLFWVFATFYICFGIQEGLSVMQTGSTISQHFWNFDALHPLRGWVIVGTMTAMWGALIIHFKMRKK